MSGGAPGLAARARTLLELGRSREAVEAARHAVAQDPGDGDAWCVLARAHLDLAEPMLALGAADRGAACWHWDPAWAHRLRAAALRRLRWPAAVDAAAQAVRLRPNDAENHVSLTHAMIAFPAHVELRPPRRRSSAPRPSRYGWIYWYTRGIRRCTHARIAAVAERAVELAPDDSQTLLALAWARHLQGRKRESRALADRALALSPDDAHVHQQRAAIMSVRGRLGSAARGYSRAAALEPGGSGATDFARTCRRAVNRGLLLGALAWLPVAIVVQILIDPKSPDAAPVESYLYRGTALAVCTAIAALPFLAMRRRLGAPDRRAAGRCVRRSPVLRLRLAGVAVLYIAIMLPPGARPDDGRGPAPPADEGAGAGSLLLLAAVILIAAATPLARWGASALARLRRGRDDP